MPSEGQSDERDKGLWRDVSAFWILGLCNNVGYVVMLSAAHDIIKLFFQKESEYRNHVEKERYCHIISTGAILLADILPSVFVKLFIPFLPLWINYRVALSVCLSAFGFLMEGFALAEWMAILGVVLTSASCGLGEPTFLAYSSNFNRKVVSTWSSGTGGAGIIGSLLYASLRAVHISPPNIMFIMLFFPTIEVLTFWTLLRSPDIVPSRAEKIEFEDTEPMKSIAEKLAFTTKILKYMVPLCLVYFFEYFINMGLFELTYFKDASIDQSAQYRWYGVDYQLGVFISRSSVNIIKVNRLWLLAVFQGINMLYFLTEVIWFYTPSIWIVLVIVFWEGLIGGAAYVNTFYKVTQEVTPSRREFAMSMVAQSDSLGIVLAGFLAIPTHNAICRINSS